MDILGGRTVVAIGNHEVLPALDEVRAEIARLRSVELQLIARCEADGLPEEVGARDTVELLTVRHRRDRAEVWRDVRLARALPRYQAVNTALTDGIQSTDGTVHQMQTGHAAAIITELERVRARVPVETLDVTEHQLVGLVPTHTPQELRTAAKHLCDRIDADGPEPDEHRAYARESLTLSTAENGVKIRGYLANENADLLRAIVHAGARPHKTVDGEHDPRPRDKRQADALTTALTVASNAWDTDTAGHGAKANITVTIDLDDLKSATAHATGQTVYSDDLSAATIRRLACDANVIPLVLGSNSEPLDVGRRERLVTRHIRHALIARDRGCVVCAAPPVMCDAHHLTSWLDGGPTALNNLTLLCRRHHVDLHNGRWHITITNGKVQVARPTWADTTAVRAAQPPDTNLPQPAETGSAQPADTRPTQPARADSAQRAGGCLARSTGVGSTRAADSSPLQPARAKPVQPTRGSLARPAGKRSAQPTGEPFARPARERSAHPTGTHLGPPAGADSTRAAAAEPARSTDDILARPARERSAQPTGTHLEPPAGPDSTRAAAAEPARSTDDILARPARERSAQPTGTHLGPPAGADSTRVAAAEPARSTDDVLARPVGADSARRAGAYPARLAGAGSSRPAAATSVRSEQSSGGVAHTPEPPGAVPAWSERSDSRPRPVEPNEPPADLWGDTAVPVARRSRWKADEATLTDAARFAVWGERAPTGPMTDPPPFVTIELGSG
ncbi:DUF222 domain-containing protein [Kribbella sp. GL6]|uniref:HNH endonuclease signature motif containing protein n=1 Tax=Kribbella sp. GL6 TaxID=3419765 RepID=UPI003CFED413